jgi:UDP:flavonoid glycosyltransferase YjiC (YdhE family)
MTGARRRILFMAEAATLAHVTRPLVLAKALDAMRHEIHFACAPGYELFFADTAFTHWPLWSIPPQQFLEALARGRPLYDQATLERYIEADLEVLDAVKPDLVVGDFRLSLAVSAAVRKIPYAALTNAHWSPYSRLGPFPLPEHPLARVLGVTAATLMFRAARPIVFTQHAVPLNRLRRRYGLDPLGDLCHAYTHGDYTLYADTPGLVPTANLPSNHQYLGPVLWSPQVELPAWWNSLPQDQPLVYVTLGSSGQATLLPDIAAELAHMPLVAAMATAGRITPDALPDGIRAAAYLPGQEAARRSQLVICNGGSATVYQALAEGVPVLGIASNMDQHLTMQAVKRAGAGILLRAGQTDRRAVRQAVLELLASPGYRQAAGQVAAEFARYDAASRFSAFVDMHFGQSGK